MCVYSTLIYLCNSLTGRDSTMRGRWHEGIGGLVRYVELSFYQFYPPSSLYPVYAVVVVELHRPISTLNPTDPKEEDEPRFINLTQYAPQHHDSKQTLIRPLSIVLITKLSYLIYLATQKLIVATRSGRIRLRTRAPISAADCEVRATHSQLPHTLSDGILQPF